MYLETESGETVGLRSAKKPKMNSGVGGRTWDIIGVFSISGLNIEIYADTSWGVNGYFCIEGKWYSAKLIELESCGFMGIEPVKIRLKKGKCSAE